MQWELHFLSVLFHPDSPHTLQIQAHDIPFPEILRLFPEQPHNPAAKHKFRCADHISFSCQNHSAVFCGRRKRDDFFCTVFHRLRKILLQCLHRCIVARQARTQSESSFAILFLSSDCWSASCSFAARFWSFCKDKLCHFHFRHGNGSGLIHTQYIYPRQCLDTFHVMDQYLFVFQASSPTPPSPHLQEGTVLPGSFRE